MKVMRFNDSFDAPALIAGTAPRPQPAAGQLLVRVHAAGVTPTELRWYPSSHTVAGEVRSGAIPGHEFSGIVEAVGEGIDSGNIGREVYGMNDWFADGATADYCTAPLTSVASKPAALSYLEAASVPISALTAWQGLFDRGRIRSGEQVLIHGGSGGVSLYAIQLAKRAGAQVITTASPHNFDLLSSLGADQIIDYHAERFEDRVRNVDLVFDVVGGETLSRSWQVLKPEGRMITIASESEGTGDVRIKKAFFIVEPNQTQLDEVSRLLDAGELVCFVDAIVPFSNASQAYCGTIQGRLGRGKLVISVTE
jgi:NADPH:quinone reductase-like Zn-dependent oxidoreductase